MQYKVGQVFYLVGTETAKVIPFRVVEEVTRTTLEGQEKTYIVELPDANQTKIPVSKLKGKIFDRLGDLRSHMIQNAKQAIDSMISDAETLAKVAYGFEEKEVLNKTEEALPLATDVPPSDFEVLGKDEVLPAEENDSVQSGNNDDIVKVDIGNGIVANMNIKDLEKVSQI